MDSIKSQVEAYEKQLKDIDQQISEAMAKEMEKQAEKSKKDEKPKTEQEIENARLANVMNLSQGLEKAEVVDSVKTRVDGEACVLKSEIAMDKMYGASLESTADRVSDKEEKLAELEKKSAELLRGRRDRGGNRGESRRAERNSGFQREGRRGGGEGRRADGGCVNAILAADPAL